MKITGYTDRGIVLEEVYNGVLLRTEEGNEIGICMRDDTLEINVMPKGAISNNWWRVNMQSETIERMQPKSTYLDDKNTGSTQ